MLLNIGIAIVLDLLIGDPPDWPHPIRFIGRVITGLERWTRAHVSQLYLGGFLLLFGTVTIVLVPIILMQVMLPPTFFNLFSIYLLYASLASKCLFLEAIKVKTSLDENALERARVQLSYLVGRDTSELTKADITRGVVETVSENTVDGVLAPLFYMLLGAPFGISVYLVWVYKVVNTLDSMVGYKQAPYKEIGFASAKADDGLNFIPARLGSVLMILSGGLMGHSVTNGFKIFIRDRKNHSSPNSGHPESAIAGLLGIRIGGTNQYFGEQVVKPTIGDATCVLMPKHIEKSARIMVVSEVAMFSLAMIIYGLTGV